jgi:hypothetical protein
LHRFDKLR